MKQKLLEQAQAGQRASRQLAALTGAVKDQLLLRIADELLARSGILLAANEEDCQAGLHQGLSQALLDRLRLTPARVTAMAEGARQVAGLLDPIGREESWRRPNGLLIRKVRVPLGLICMIYEARPNVTVESSCLAIKSGNACLLRGSRSAWRSNEVLIELIQDCLAESGLPRECVQGVVDLSHESIDILGGLRGHIDLLIPRGGASLIQRVVECARVPVLETGVGNCHLFVHRQADLDLVVPLVINSKCSRPAVCNSLETLLLDAPVAAEALARLAPALQEQEVEVRGCPQTLAMLGWGNPVTQADYAEEFLEKILAVRVVDDLDQALQHIQQYGSGHTECILTTNLSAARRFQVEVDACTVNVNASTRFTDGGEFGFGAEIGISTQKMHARGPVGLAELTTYKYWVEGNGQIR